MAVRPIVTFPDPVLKQRCAEVTSFDADLHTLLDDMADTMEGHGIGLAANQVGVSLRVFVMDVPLGGKSDGRQEVESHESTGLLELINPRILARRGEIKYQEGCLSFPGLYEDVNRAAEVDVVFQDRHGQEQRLAAHGLVAICIQHELDHLDGITFVDRLSPLKKRIALRDYLRAQQREALEDTPAPRAPAGKGGRRAMG